MKGRDHLDLFGAETKRRRKAVPNGLGVLCAFVNGELVALPFRDRGDQLNRILVLWWAVEHRIDLDWARRRKPCRRRRQ